MPDPVSVEDPFRHLETSAMTDSDEPRGVFIDGVYTRPFTEDD